MNYRKTYFKLIRKAISENRVKGEIYYESHHIIPESCGGVGTVLLTAREHFIAHLLLTKFSPRRWKKQCVFAFQMMFLNNPNQSRLSNSKWYEYSRRLSSEQMKETVAERWKFERENGIKRDYSNSKGPKGYTQSEEHKRKRTEHRKRKINVYGTIYSSLGDAIKKSDYTHWHINTRLKKQNSGVFYVT